MSQSQFDSLDENTRQSFLEKQLWIKGNYEVCHLKFFLSVFVVSSVLLLCLHLSSEPLPLFPIQKQNWDILLMPEGNFGQLQLLQQLKIQRGNKNLLKCSKI